MKYWRLYFLFIYLFCIIESFAQEVDLTGVVIGCNGKPVSEAIVEIQKLSLFDTTEQDGSFKIKEVVSIKHYINHFSNLNTLSSAKKIIEIWNIKGQRLIRFSARTNTEAVKKIRNKFLQNQLPRNQIYIYRIKTKEKQFTIKALGISIIRTNRLFNEEKIQKTISAKTFNNIDTIMISLANFPATKVVIDSYIKNLDSISFTKSVDANNIPVSCEQQMTEALSLAGSGAALMLDSLKKSPFMDNILSINELEIVPGDNKKIIVSCIPWGCYARIKSVAYRLETACILEGLAAREKIDSLSPIISCKAPGLIIASGSTLDTNATVVIHYGDIKDENHNPIPEYQKIKETKEISPLPFNETVFSNYMEKQWNEYNVYLTDQNAIPSDSTFIISNIFVFPRDTVIVLNNCTITDVKIEGKTIVSSGSMFIDSNVIMENSKLYALDFNLDSKKASQCLFFSYGLQQVNSGEYNAQFYSFDSINISSTVSTDPQTVFLSQRTKKVGEITSGGVYVEANSILHGTIISYADTSTDSLYSVTPVFIDAQSEFTGIAVCDEDMSFKFISINGHIWYRKLRTVYDGVGYTDWLLGVRIKLPEEKLPFPLINELPVSLIFQKNSISWFYPVY